MPNPLSDEERKALITLFRRADVCVLHVKGQSIALGGDMIEAIIKTLERETPNDPRKTIR